MIEYHTTLSTHELIAITIGNFDGIHLGHQRLLHELHALAQEVQARPVMVTFSPHTVAVVRPDIQAQFLTTLDEKVALASQYGQVTDTVVIPFTPEVANQSAEAFMDGLLERFAIRGIVVGANFSLGHKRMGDITFLSQYAQKHGIQFRSISLEELHQDQISSTRIRKLVNAGEVAEANALLGHPLIFSASVVHGDERGRLLGFPTANLRPAVQKLLPMNGVYAAYVQVHNGPGSDSQSPSTVYKSVVNIGVRPTFDGKERLVEVHLLDVTLDLYDKLLTVQFVEHLRGEQRFSGIDALKTQIASDVQRAGQILMSRRVSN